MVDHPHASGGDGPADSTRDATVPDGAHVYEEPGGLDVVPPAELADVTDHRERVLNTVEANGKDTARAARGVEAGAVVLRTDALRTRGKANPEAFARRRQQGETRAFATTLFAEAHQPKDAARTIDKALAAYDRALDVAAPEQVREVHKAKREIADGLAQQPEINGLLSDDPKSNAAVRVERARQEVQYIRGTPMPRQASRGAWPAS